MLIVDPSKKLLLSLPFSTMRKSFGSGRSGTKPSSRAIARGPTTSMPCAASPPTAFCQEKVTTSSFSQGSACAKTAEVASQIVRPALSAGIISAEGTRTPEVVPFQVKTTSRSKSIAAKSGSCP